MRKLFFIVFHIFCFTAAAQTKTIDSLKRLLPALQDTARINCLNKLAWRFTDNYIHSDSANKYADMALQESAAINFTKGKAVAFHLKAFVAGWLLGRHKMAEEFFRQCLEECKKINDEKRLARAYFYLGDCYSVTGRYDSCLLLVNKARQIAENAGDIEQVVEILQFLGHVYLRIGDYWKSFELSSSAQKIAAANHDSTLFIPVESTLSRLHELTGDYQKQLLYAFEELKKLNKGKRVKSFAHPYGSIGKAYLSLGQFDSALYYQQQYLIVIDSFTNDEKIRNKFRAIPLGFIGSIHLAKKEYDKVISYFKEDLVVQKANGDFIWTLQALFHLAKAYEGKKEFASAMLYARELFLTASKAGQKEYTRDGSQVMASIFEQLKQTDSAYFYYKQYSTMKDSMAVEQVRAGMALYNNTVEAEKKIGLLNKDKEIQKQQLRKESQAKKFLMACVLGLALIGFFIFRNIMLKRKNEQLQHEQKQAQLQQQGAELEMQALRAQMNPHFIFNCLSSINRFILKNEAEAASDYLTRFSRLIRMVLNHSKETIITLEDELEMLQLYLDMERLRFKNSFDYTIHCSDGLDISAIHIPPLLLQPFAENAIWHGLMHKKGEGHLSIELKDDDNALSCIITDNGIGRKAAAAFNSKSVEKEKSMGLQITKERLAMLNNGKKTFFEIDDLVDDKGMTAGTKVILKIGHHELKTEGFDSTALAKPIIT